MRVVIADDEYLVRVSIKSMLLDLKLSIEIVGEAANGEELVNLIKTHNPDVAFVDIKMPKLSGLEAIKKAKSYSPDTQWIILSGFSEFDFAKKAIDLGASNYLLKPVGPEELQGVMEELFKRNKEYNSMLNTEFENDLIALVHDLNTFSYNIETKFTPQNKYLCSLFIIDSSLAEKDKCSLQNKFYKSARIIIDKLSTSDARLALFPMQNGELAAVGACGLRNPEQAKHTMKTYFAEITSLARQLSTDNFFITVLYSDECSSLPELRKRLMELQELSYIRPIIYYEQRLSFDKTSQYYKSTSSELLNLCNLLLELSTAYKERVYLCYMKSLDKIEKTMLSSKHHSCDNIHQAVFKFLLHTINFSEPIGNDVRAWIKALKKYGENLLVEIHKEESSPYVIDNVAVFIEQNYMTDISIGQIAEELNFTPNYLSALFHKKTGITFMKYLTKIRMLKAKELLANSNIQVQEAAEKVGYYSTRYFTKLFKEFYGCYPSEYRDKLKENKAL